MVIFFCPASVFSIFWEDATFSGKALETETVFFFVFGEEKRIAKARQREQHKNTIPHKRFTFCLSNFTRPFLEVRRLACFFLGEEVFNSFPVFFTVFFSVIFTVNNIVFTKKFEYDERLQSKKECTPD